MFSFAKYKYSLSVLLVLFFTSNSTYALNCQSFLSESSQTQSRDSYNINFLNEGKDFNFSRLAYERIRSESLDHSNNLTKQPENENPTPEELLALSSIEGYTGYYHTVINDGVWNSDIFSNGIKEIKGAYIYLENSPHYEGTVYRYARMDNSEFNELNPGDSFTFGFFASTTKIHDNKFANDFGTKKDENKTNLVFQISSLTSVDIEANSRLKSEAEALIRPDTKFSIKEVIPAAGEDRPIVVLEEIYPAPPKADPATYSNEEPDVQRFLPQPLERALADPIIVENWVKASKHLSENKSTLKASPDLLKLINEMCMQGLPFRGFEKRRVREQFQSRVISLDKALSEIERIDSDDFKNEVTNLPGLYRPDKVDNLILTGLTVNENGQYYFSKEELFRILTDIRFTVDSNSIVEISPGQFTANVLFTPSGDSIQIEVQKAFDLFYQNTKSDALDDRTYVLEVLRLERALIAIHPFLDGNGRSIRLLSDLLYMQRGIALPHKPFENDYTARLYEQYHAVVSNMQQP